MAEGRNQAVSVTQDSPAGVYRIIPGLMGLPLVAIAELTPDPANGWSHGQKQIDQIRASLRRWSQRRPAVVQVAADGTKVVRAGNAMLAAARAEGWTHLACVLVQEDEASAVGYAIADNMTSRGRVEDQDALRRLIQVLDAQDLGALGMDPEELQALGAAMPGAGDGGAAPADQALAAVTLAERFGVVPFTVLDARSGWWLARKRAWLAMGIKSEVGRTAQAYAIGDKSAWERKASADQAATLPSASGRDPTFYAQKQDVERRLGHLIDVADFEARYYKPPTSGAGNLTTEGVSVFDPVLCEMAYRWFCPPGGLILDPFAGGSVRGIVAAKIGRRYLGIDLRQEQVTANRDQWAAVCGHPAQVAASDDDITDPDAITPVMSAGGYLVKRDDLFTIDGGRGGKARTCLGLARGAAGLTSAGSRSSPQMNIVAGVARHLGIPAMLHTSEGAYTPEMAQAVQRGGQITQHKAGYNNVIYARARDDAKTRGWVEIPFGMECPEAITNTRRQVANIPTTVARIVVSVGSGMSLAGILWGLKDAGLSIPVLGVVVGADPRKRLAKYAPKDWANMVTLEDAGMDYSASPDQTTLGQIKLDPIYEAKCIRFMRDGDLLWVVGCRASMVGESDAAAGAAPPVWVCGDSLTVLDDVPDGSADMIWTCPPYGDLEVYSDNPQDLSTMSWDQFLVAYRAILAKAGAKLKPDRFAGIVVGDFRDDRGLYRDFVSATIDAARAAGLSLYNEAILVTPIGSLAVRLAKQFTTSRKMGKTHQNVLIFVKGDPKKATQAVGDVEVGDIDAATGQAAQDGGGQ